MLKFVTIIFATLYVIALGLWTAGNFKFLGYDKTEVPRQILEGMGFPWREWFRDQLTDFTAPWITFAVLLLAAYLAKRDRRGVAR